MVVSGRWLLKCAVVDGLSAYTLGQTAAFPNHFKERCPVKKIEISSMELYEQNISHRIILVCLNWLDTSWQYPKKAGTVWTIMAPVGSSSVLQAIRVFCIFQTASTRLRLLHSILGLWQKDQICSLATNKPIAVPNHCMTFSLRHSHQRIYNIWLDIISPV